MWVKLDDQFTEHPKVRQLSDRAFRLHVAALCHCGAYMTDGLVEARKVGGLLDRVTKRMVAELVDAGLWLPHEVGFEIKDFLVYNPSREQVKQKREEEADRKRRWREKKERDASRDAGHDGGRDARPDPARPEGSRAGVSEEPFAVASSPAPSGGDDEPPRPDTALGAEVIEMASREVKALKEKLRGNA